MATLKHVHQYVRFRLTKNSGVQYRCADPRCTHFTYKKALRGKLSRCNDCGAEFILTPKQLCADRPKCLNCQNTKEGRAFRAAIQAMKNIDQTLEEILQDISPTVPATPILIVDMTLDEPESTENDKA